MPLCQNLKEEGGATESNDWSHVRIFWCQVQAEGSDSLDRSWSGLTAPPGPRGFAIALIKKLSVRHKSLFSDGVVFLMRVWKDAKVHVSVNMRSEIKSARGFFASVTW